MKTRLIGIALACLATPGVAWGEVVFNYLEAGYINTEIDTSFGDDDGDGFSLAGSFDINDEFFLFGDYAVFDIGIVDFSTLKLGGGYRTSAGGPAQLVGTVAFARAEADAGSFGDESDTGFALSFGARGEFSPEVEWDLFLNYIDIDESDTSVKGAARYKFTPTLAVGASLESGDDVTTFGVQMRWLYQ